MKIKEKLALLGGRPAVDIKPPHYVWPNITDAEISAVVNQMKSGHLSYYRRDGIIELFEKEFSNFHNIKYAISTNSGTAALHAAFFSLNLEPGSEVIAPAYTHLATVLPMLHVGLIPVLCDINCETGNIDPLAIEKKISIHTKAIVLTHQYGHVCEMDKICTIARKHKLFIIEDCSHAHGATLNDKLAGTFGDIGCFSLQAHKSVWGGEGGILITNNPKLADRASLFGHFRQEQDYTAKENSELAESGYGLKNRLHPLSAALARVQLRQLPSLIKKRQKNYAYFNKKLAGIRAIVPLKNDAGIKRGGFFRFVFKYNPSALDGLSIDTYLKALKAEGVITAMPGALARPLHSFTIFREYSTDFSPYFFSNELKEKRKKFIYKIGDFPVSEKFSNFTIQFPAFTEPSFHIIDQYITAMHKIQFHVQKLKLIDK